MTQYHRFMNSHDGLVMSGSLTSQIMVSQINSGLIIIHGAEALCTRSRSNVAVCLLVKRRQRIMLPEELWKHIIPNWFSRANEISHIVFLRRIYSNVKNMVVVFCCSFLKECRRSEPLWNDEALFTTWCRGNRAKECERYQTEICPTVDMTSSSALNMSVKKKHVRNDTKTFNLRG